MNRKWTNYAGRGMLAIGFIVAMAVAGFAKSDGANVVGGSIRVEKLAEADFPSLAKVTADQAMQNALGRVPGSVLKTELEEENGFLVYVVEVVTPEKSIKDIKVDAGNGKVLAVTTDKADGKDHESGEHDGDKDSED